MADCLDPVMFERLYLPVAEVTLVTDFRVGLLSRNEASSLMTLFVLLSTCTIYTSVDFLIIFVFIEAIEGW